MKQLLQTIDLECALLEDVLHGQEGKAITHIRHLLSNVMKDESLPGSAGMREALIKIRDLTAADVSDPLKALNHMQIIARDALIEQIEEIDFEQALSSTGEEKWVSVEDGGMEEHVIYWVAQQDGSVSLSEYSNGFFRFPGAFQSLYYQPSHYMRTTKPLPPSPSKPQQK